MIYVFSLGIILAAGGYVFWQVRQRGLHFWLPSYLVETPKRKVPRLGQSVHLLLCIADHFEPHNGNVSDEVANSRVRNWLQEYPRLYCNLRDSDGCPPRHTFFFPLEQYDADHIDALGELCRQGFGEVEVHLHHDGDTAHDLHERLLAFKAVMASRHGQLARHKKTGQVAYAFIHGNWALDNSRPDGRLCGVNNELDVLRESGCYADFTLPSAPSPTQTRKINSIYYAIDDPHRPKSHDTGIDVGSGPAPSQALLLIQGPLLFNWKYRKWGLMPRVENGCVQGNQAPSIDRLQLWLKARVQVPTRPDWFFVKLHTHGAPEANQRVLLGEPTLRFHQGLARLAQQDANFHFHYVTAREMYNLVRAAEAGWKGSVAEARDFELEWNGGACNGTSQNERSATVPLSRPPETTPA
jgi:hypothetical protein